MSAPHRNLATYRWCGPIPTAEEELALIVRAQAGDDTAGWELIRSFHRKIVKLAAKHVPGGSTYRKKLPGRKQATEHTNGLFDDLVAEGSLALWQAIKDYDLASGYRLWTFASKSVAGAISDAAGAFRQHVSGCTRIDRWLFGHWNAAPGQLLAAVERLGLRRGPRTIGEAQELIEEFRIRYQRKPIDWVFFNPGQLALHLVVHKKISGIVDDLAIGKHVEPKRYRQVEKYFDQEEKRKWIPKESTIGTPLPLVRPRHWHAPSKKQRRRSSSVRATSVAER